ncbi:hypothetical protein OF83DRAFT_1175648 [Amylostereum chailletii]|nr:hypothetical protein OF83DRAFT_1175648 [Amylostereum chailletii]
MQTLVPHILRSCGPTQLSASSRRFLASITQHTPPSRIYRRRLRQLIDSFKQRTKDPVWPLLSVPDSPLLKRIDGLRAAGVPAAEYSKWRPVLRSSPLNTALAKVEQETSPSPDVLGDVADFISLSSSTRPQAYPPTWVILRLCLRVRMVEDARRVTLLAASHLPYTPAHLRAPLLLILAHGLLSHQAFDMAERIVQLFLGLPLFDESWHFNVLLRLLASATSWEDGRTLGVVAVRVLDTMTERGLKLEPVTHRLLLANTYITLQLADKIRSQMRREGIVPSREELEAFLRISTHRNRHSQANTYAHSLHHERFDHDPPPHPIPTRKPQRTPSTYLEALADASNWRHHQHANTHTGWHSLTHHRIYMRPRVGFRAAPITQAVWSAHLYILSRTRSVSAQSLLDFFYHSRPFRHTAKAYAVVIQGLLRKNAYDLAEVIWRRFRLTGLPMDRVLLGVGVQVLVHAGTPNSALGLLDNWSEGDFARRVRSQRIPIDGNLATDVVNKFMDALIKTLRPNAVLTLWEHMQRLYGAIPDANTLFYVLTAARLASHNFETLRGALRELGFPFRLMQHSKNTEETEPRSLVDVRREAREELKHALDPRTKGTDEWGGVKAWRWARGEFLAILADNTPYLRDVAAPAVAVRASSDDVANAPFGDMLRWHPRAGNADAFPVGIPSHGLRAHSTLIPNDRVFRAYIHILGTHALGAEIPRVLAWMRALGIVPKRETLAYALVYWGEVTVDAPLVGAFRGSGKDEYVKLVKWILDWAGYVPSDTDFGMAMRRVERMRRGKHIQDIY